MTEVYVIGEQPELRLVKIGVAADAAERITELRRSNGDTITPPDVDRRLLALLFRAHGDEITEEALHWYFDDRRVCGEWFDLGADVQAVTAQVAAAVRLVNYVRSGTRNAPRSATLTTDNSLAPMYDEFTDAVRRLAADGVREFSNATVLELCPTWSSVAMCRHLKRVAAGSRTPPAGFTIKRLQPGRYRLISSITQEGTRV